jgi:hypothetical protein
MWLNNIVVTCSIAMNMGYSRWHVSYNIIFREENHDNNFNLKDENFEITRSVLYKICMSTS